MPFASLKEKNLVFGIEIYSHSENEILRHSDASVRSVRPFQDDEKGSSSYIDLIF